MYDAMWPSYFVSNAYHQPEASHQSQGSWMLALKSPAGNDDVRGSAMPRA